MNTTLRVTITGVECTGKTRLTTELGALFHAPVLPEYARHYLEFVQRPLGIADVEPIERGQMRIQNALLIGHPPVVMLDTDIVSTAVYARYYFGTCPSWIEEAAHLKHADLYLPLFPDVLWIPDGLQRDSLTASAEIHECLIEPQRLVLQSTCLT